MKTYALILPIFAFSGATAGITVPAITAPGLSFKITYRNYHFGYVKAVKYVSDTTSTYTIQGRSEGDLFFKKIVAESSVYTVFKKQEFVNSTTLSKRNGKTLNNTHTALLKGKYIVSTAEKTVQLTDHIDFTVALLYFQEPLGIQKVYSEAWGKVLPLVNTDNHYTFTIPDGTVCTFEYKAGLLYEATFKTIIGEVKFTKE